MFLDRFGEIEMIQNTDMDQLYDEFCDYRSLHDDNIPEEAWNQAKVIDGKDADEKEIYHYRIDILWWHFSMLTIPGTNVKRFQHLMKVAEVVLVIPHSNAELESLLSVVKKSKSDSRASLKLDGTLSSILPIKSNL